MARRILNRANIGVIIVASVLLLIPLVFFIAYPDEPHTPSGFHIINHTQTAVEIFQVLSDGTEVGKLELQPGEEKDSGIPCGMVPVVARTSGGELVARRGPFDVCNTDPWTIERGTVAP
jgi:hypothetical protein